MKRYWIEQLDDLPPTACSCGEARRAFMDVEPSVASIHLVDISKDSRTHFHKHHTEIYVILEGEGFLELDGDRIKVRPMMSVLIHPGCRHRAIGDMRILNIPIPAYDHGDEYFDHDQP